MRMTGDTGTIEEELEARLKDCEKRASDCQRYGSPEDAILYFGHAQGLKYAIVQLSNRTKDEELRKIEKDLLKYKACKEFVRQLAWLGSNSPISKEKSEIQKWAWEEFEKIFGEKP